jgi:hypothetical protein
MVLILQSTPCGENMISLEVWQQGDLQVLCTNQQVQIIAFWMISLPNSLLGASRGKTCHCGSHCHVRYGGVMELCEKERLMIYM